MKNLDNIKTAWQQHNHQTINPSLTERDIMLYIEQQSSDISTLFRKGLITDVIIKSVLLISFMGLIKIYQNQVPVMGISIALLVFSLLLLAIQYVFYRQVAGIEDPLQDTRTLLKNKIDYFYKKYTRAIVIAALTNPLLVLSGFLYYFYLKYGSVRPLDTIDIMVFGSAIALSFVISVAAQFYQYRFHVKQLEESLEELEQDTIDEQMIQTWKQKRVRLVLFAVLALVLGLMIFAYIVILQ